MRACDTLLVVSDSTPAGLRAAQRIGGLADELQIKIGRRLLIINRSSGAVEKEKFKGINLDYAGNIPDDNEIEDISLDGGSLINLKDNALGLAALRKLGEKLWN
jgi:CO dehydrogenase maturation factor